VASLKVFFYLNAVKYESYAFADFAELAIRDGSPVLANQMNHWVNAVLLRSKPNQIKKFIRT